MPREWRDIGAAIQLHYFALAAFFNFVDPDDGVHRNQCATDATELTLEFLFGWIDDQSAVFAKNQPFDFDKPVNIGLIHRFGKKLIDFSLINE